MENIQLGNSLEDFTWDSPTDAASFFSDFTEPVDTTKVTDNEEEDYTEGDKGEEGKETTKTKAPSKVKNSQESEEDEEEGEDLFSDFKDGELEDKSSKTSKDKQTELSANTALEKFNTFKEQGIFKHVELEEDEEIDDERFEELLEEEYETEVSQRLQDWATKELDDDARAFIAFKQKGGRTQDFFKAAQSFNVLEGDIEDETFQRKVIEHQLKLEDWDDEEIADRLETLSETNRLANTASKYYDRLKTKAEKEKETLVEKQAEQRERAEANKREFKSNLRNTLSSIRDVKGMKITPKEKSDIYKFITDETEVVGNRKVTPFQKAIAESIQDENKMILLAKLLKSDFDFSDFEKQIKNKEVKKLKENLESRKGLRPTSSGKSSMEGKSLGDIFSQF